MCAAPSSPPTPSRRWPPRLFLTYLDFAGGMTDPHVQKMHATFLHHFPGAYNESHLTFLDAPKNCLSSNEPTDGQRLGV